MRVKTRSMKHFAEFLWLVDFKCSLIESLTAGFRRKSLQFPRYDSARRTSIAVYLVTERADITEGTYSVEDVRASVSPCHD